MSKFRKGHYQIWNTRPRIEPRVYATREELELAVDGEPPGRYPVSRNLFDGTGDWEDCGVLVRLEDGTTEWHDRPDDEV